jgi:hypothetical protein
MGFDQLRTVGGDFVLMESYDITAIDGLGELREIGGDLRIEGTDYLRELILDELATVGGGLFLEYNSGMATLSASSLASVGGNFGLWRNDSLMSLGGLGQLTTVGGSYSVARNESLPQQEALDLRDRLVANGFSGTTRVYGTGDGHE